MVYEGIFPYVTMTTLYITNIQFRVKIWKVTEDLNPLAYCNSIPVNVEY